MLAACQRETADSAACNMDMQISEQESRLAPMADDHHQSSTSLSPPVVSKCDLLPPPQHCTLTPCFTTRKLQCITTHYTTCCIVNAELFWSCLLACTRVCVSICEHTYFYASIPTARAARIAHNLISQHLTPFPTLSIRPGITLHTSCALFLC